MKGMIWGLEKDKMPQHLQIKISLPKWAGSRIRLKPELGKSPSPDVLTFMATLGWAIGKRKPESCVDEAYEIWQAAD